MIEFLTTIFEFPTVAFTVPLALVLLYWCFVLLGAAEIDMFDPDGMLEGAVDAVDGALDAVEGFGADGAELPDGIYAAEAVDGGDGGEGAGGLSRVLSVLGIAGVPLTVSVSLIVIIGWLVTYGLTRWLTGGATETPETITWLPALGVLAAGVVAGTIVAAGAAKPLRPVFHVHLAKENRSFVGSVCTVTTLRVDDSFGQAEIVDGGAGLLVQIRSSRANDLTKGSQALIFDYEPREGVFLVTPLDAALQPTTAAGTTGSRQAAPSTTTADAAVTQIDLKIDNATEIETDPDALGSRGAGPGPSKRTKES